MELGRVESGQVGQDRTGQDRKEFLRLLELVDRVFFYFEAFFFSMLVT